jgi:hypothetical protein
MSETPRDVYKCLNRFGVMLVCVCVCVFLSLFVHENIPIASETPRDVYKCLDWFGVMLVSLCLLRLLGNVLTPWTGNNTHVCVSVCVCFGLAWCYAGVEVCV